MALLPLVPVALGSWLVSMVVPIAKKALIALGISVVTYTGINIVLTNIQSEIIASVGGMVGAGAQLAAMWGFHESVGILLAAITTKYSMATLTRWVKS